MQNSFMGPKRFGKPRLAPRKKGITLDDYAEEILEVIKETIPTSVSETLSPKTPLTSNPPKPINKSPESKNIKPQTTNKTNDINVRPNMNNNNNNNYNYNNNTLNPKGQTTTQKSPLAQANNLNQRSSAKGANEPVSRQVSNPIKNIINQSFKSKNINNNPTTVNSNVNLSVPTKINTNQPTNKMKQPHKRNNNAVKEPSLKVIALGGLREVGKNMFVMEFENDMIIVDCGIGFPEENMPGIDVVIPDMSYVIQNKSKVRGIFFTHGHEDHIGAVSWLLKEIDAPVYGSKLTISLVRLKMEDRGGAPRHADLHPIEDGDIIKAGVFSVEFIHTNHSIADANLLSIRTPVGIVVHTGDFKIDYTPINGDPISIPRIASIGQEKPLLLLCESTNIEKPGFSMSESKVGESFVNIFEKATGRIFIATFSSNIYRMQQIFTAAEKFNRKVCLVGRSIVNVFKAANALGYMTMKPGTLVDLNQIKSIPPEQLVIISTGSQGEPLSALTRMAFNEHQKIEIHSGDTVIISASPIPGNEKPIYRVINELFLRGANVIYASLAEVHASGHAYQEELKLMHQLVRPQFFVPIHGEYRMLHQHVQLAEKMGLPSGNSFLLSNGDVLELTRTSAKVTGYIPAEGVLIDGSSMGEIGNLVLRDRKLLSDDGVISVSIAIDKESGVLLGEPNIQARGFIYESESDRIIEESKNKIYVFIRRCDSTNKPLLAMLRTNALRDQLRDFLFDKTRRKPIVIVSVIEV